MLQVYGRCCSMHVQFLEPLVCVFRYIVDANGGGNPLPQNISALTNLQSL